MADLKHTGTLHSLRDQFKMSVKTIDSSPAHHLIVLQFCFFNRCLTSFSSIRKCGLGGGVSFRGLTVKLHSNLQYN